MKSLKIQYPLLISLCPREKVKNNAEQCRFLPEKIMCPHYCCSNGLAKIILLLFVMVSSLPVKTQAQNVYDPLKPDDECTGSPPTYRCLCDLKVLVSRYSELAQIEASKGRRPLDDDMDRLVTFQGSLNAVPCPYWYTGPEFLEIVTNDAVADVLRMRSRTRRIPHYFQHGASASWGGGGMPNAYKQYLASLKQNNPGRLFRRRRRVKRQLMTHNPAFSKIRGNPADFFMKRLRAKLGERANHTYVAMGAPAALHCQESGRGGLVQDNLVRKTNVAYNWTHSDGRPVTSPNHNINKHSGVLKFSAAELADADTYRCHIHYEPYWLEQFPNLVDREFKHELSVVVEPVEWTHVSALYTIKKDECDQDELLLIREFISDWMFELCDFCTTHNASVLCLRDEASGKPLINIFFSVTVFSLENQITNLPSYSASCGLGCMAVLHRVLVSRIEHNVKKFFHAPIKVNNKGSMTSYEPLTTFPETTTGFTCPPGFGNPQPLCVPCAAGKYSPNQNQNCTACSKGTYQPTPGSSDCFACPSGHTTLEEGATGIEQCKLAGLAYLLIIIKENKAYFMYLGGSFVALIALLCLIPCMCPNTPCGRFLAPCSCCAPDKEEELEGANNKKVKGRKGKKGRGGNKKKKMEAYEEVDQEDNDDEDIYKDDDGERFMRTNIDEEDDDGEREVYYSTVTNTNNYAPPPPLKKSSKSKYSNKDLDLLNNNVVNMEDERGFGDYQGHHHQGSQPTPPYSYLYPSSGARQSPEPPKPPPFPFFHYSSPSSTLNNNNNPYVTDLVPFSYKEPEHRKGPNRIERILRDNYNYRSSRKLNSLITPVMSATPSPSESEDMMGVLEPEMGSMVPYYPPKERRRDLPKGFGGQRMDMDPQRRPRRTPNFYNNPPTFPNFREPPPPPRGMYYDSGDESGSGYAPGSRVNRYHNYGEDNIRRSHHRRSRITSYDDDDDNDQFSTTSGRSVKELARQFDYGYTPPPQYPSIGRRRSRNVQFEPMTRTRLLLPEERRPVINPTYHEYEEELKGSPTPPSYPMMRQKTKLRPTRVTNTSLTPSGTSGNQTQGKHQYRQQQSIILPKTKGPLRLSSNEFSPHHPVNVREMARRLEEMRGLSRRESKEDTLLPPGAFTYTPRNNNSSRT